MTEDLVLALTRKLDLADKLLRWQIALMGLVIAGAVWGTTTNYRISAIETDRSLRLPAFDAWKSNTDLELANHELRLKSLEIRH